MAEILGVVTGAFAVAELTGKFGMSLFKLKQLWDEVQEVPESINRTLRQLELVRPVIAELEAVLLEQTENAYQGSAAYSSIQACNHVVDEMEALAVELQSQIATARRSRRSIAKLKVSFKKESIQNHHERLRFILDLVSISQMTCMMAAVRPQSPKRLLQNAHTGVYEPLKRKPSMGEDAETRQTRMKIVDHLYNVDKNIENAGVEIRTTRLKLPGWITEKIWDLQASKAYDGWKISLRPWTTRPRDAPIFRYAKYGMVQEMLQAFRDNEASPWDRDERRDSLLHYASYYGYFDMIKSLLSMGLSFHDTQNDVRPPLNSLWLSSEDVDEVMRLSRFLLWNSALEDDQVMAENPFSEQNHFSFFGVMWKFAEFRKEIIQKVGVNYYELPLGSRFSSLCWFRVDPAVLIDDLRQNEGVQAADFRAALMHRHVFGASLYAFANQYANDTPYFNPKTSRYLEEHRTTTENTFASWRKLARWLFTDMSLDEMTETYYRVPYDDHVTALSSAIASPLRFMETSRPADVKDKRENKYRVGRFLTSWVEAARSAGIDLVEYGRRELELFAGIKGILQNRWCELDIGPQAEGYPLSGPRLVSFTYGPEPEDWKLIWYPDTEEFAGEFWDLVEDRPLPVPGAWEEDW